MHDTQTAVDDGDGAVYVVPYRTSNGVVVNTIYFSREDAPPDAVRMGRRKKLHAEINNDGC